MSYKKGIKLEKIPIYRSKIRFFCITMGQKNDMFSINALTGSEVAQYISEHFGTNNIEIGQKLWLRRHFSTFFVTKEAKITLIITF